MSAEGLAGALITPIIDALAGIVRQHGEARAREEAARVAAMLAEELHTPRPIDEVIAEARRKSLPETARVLYELEHSVYSTTSQKPHLAAARELVESITKR